MTPDDSIRPFGEDDSSWAADADRTLSISGLGLEDEVIDFEDDGLDATVVASVEAVSLEEPSAMALDDSTDAEDSAAVPDTSTIAALLAHVEQLEQQQREDHRQLHTNGFALSTLQTEVQRLAASASVAPAAPSPAKPADTAVFARDAASSHPAALSWSVIASTSSPARRASATSSVGVLVPSEQLVWVCRSILTPRG